MPRSTTPDERVVAGHRVVTWPSRASGRPILLLHGFTGRSESWRRVAERVRRSARNGPAPRLVACDLPGHHPGLPVVARGGWDGAVDRLARVVAELQLGDVHVAGYSMGARLGLGLVARHPDMVSRATLIGVHPGLTDDGARAARRDVEALWARRLREEGTRSFMREWERHPVLASQCELGDEIRREQSRLRRSHDAERLAAGLELLGLSVMPSFWPSLAALAMPVELVVGARDEKFGPLARRAAGRLPRGTLRVVDHAGHNVVLEAPDTVADLLQDEEAE